MSPLCLIHGDFKQFLDYSDVYLYKILKACTLYDENTNDGKLKCTHLEKIVQKRLFSLYDCFLITNLNSKSAFRFV